MLKPFNRKENAVTVTVGDQKAVNFLNEEQISVVTEGYMISVATTHLAMVARKQPQIVYELMNLTAC